VDHQHHRLPNNQADSSFNGGNNGSGMIVDLNSSPIKGQDVYEKAFGDEEIGYDDRDIVGGEEVDIMVDGIDIDNDINVTANLTLPGFLYCGAFEANRSTISIVSH
jgi:hypothetical protein